VKNLSSIDAGETWSEALDLAVSERAIFQKELGEKKTPEKEKGKKKKNKVETMCQCESQSRIVPMKPSMN